MKSDQRSQRVLFIAPVPPPMHGQSLASKVFLDSIRGANRVTLVNTAGKRRSGFVSSLFRAISLIGLQARIAVSAWRADVIYLTNSETLGGNLKDFVTYALCFPWLGRMTIHLHGGAGMRELMKGRHRWLPGLNRFFTKRMRGVIVLGDSLRTIYSEFIPSDRLHVVPNFSLDEVFSTNEAIREKFSKPGPIRVVFLSNLIPSKGYAEVIQSVCTLNSCGAPQVVLSLAGGLPQGLTAAALAESWEGRPGVEYVGTVYGAEKVQFLQTAHIFILPTYYPYEGQPISILEAYAAGCVVITTDHSGIFDVFQPGLNGFEVQKRSAASIEGVLRAIVRDPSALEAMALRNHEAACRMYRVQTYCERLAAAVGLQTSYACQDEPRQR